MRRGVKTSWRQSPTGNWSSIELAIRALGTPRCLEDDHRAVRVDEVDDAEVSEAKSPEVRP
jgi:hypothetical protein